MADPKSNPLDGGDFPEETRLRDGPMDQEILVMAVEALNKQGHPTVTPDSARSDPEHRALLIDMLRDCRPMPVILELIDRLERA